jgi:hypothetical protein
MTDDPKSWCADRLQDCSVFWGSMDDEGSMALDSEEAGEFVKMFSSPEFYSILMHLDPNEARRADKQAVLGRKTQAESYVQETMAVSLFRLFL